MDVANPVGVKGSLIVELIGEDGVVKERQEIKNLITQFGDQYYGERAGGVSGAPAVATGMQLGTSITAVAKTGAGSAIVTLVASSLVALTGTPTSSLVSGSRRIAYAVSWAPGTATNSNINECVLTNQSTGTQTAAAAGSTVARALFSSPVNKTATDTLNVTWNHDLLGA